MKKLKVLALGLGLAMGLTGAAFAVGAANATTESCSLGGGKSASCCKPEAACCKDGSCPLCKAKAAKR